MDKNTRTLAGVFVVVACMIGLSFAAVPLYSLFCRVTGFSGTTQVSDTAPDRVFDRVITVQFNTDTAPDMPWSFEPDVRKMDVQVGAQNFINFTSRNNTSKPMEGTAVYNVTPLKSGRYFVKTQCFCFGRQILQPGQKVNMPVLFYIDPSIMDNRDMDDVHTITLSYTFFKSDSNALEQAIEAFYDGDHSGNAVTP